MKFEDDELAEEEFDNEQKITLHKSLTDFYSAKMDKDAEE